MKPGNPWNVKGTQPAAREAAKEVARRQGMPLGQWLNHVILDNSEEQSDAITGQQHPPRQQKPATPQLASSPGSKSQKLQDKIEDISTRLDAIFNQQSNQVDLDQWETTKGRSSGWGDLAVRTVARNDVSPKTGQYTPKPPIQPERKSEIIDQRLSALAEKLDSVVETRAATKSRSEQGLIELESALQNVINHIEASDRQNTDVMKSIQARLSELSSRTAASNNDAVQQLSGTVSEIEERLAHLSQRILQTEASVSEFPGFEEQVKGLTDRLDNSLNRAADPKIFALEEQTNQLSARFEDFLLTSGDANAADQYDRRLNEISSQLKNTEQQYLKLSSLEDSVNQLFDAVEQDRITARDNTFNTNQKAIKTMETMVGKAAEKAAENAAQRSAEHVTAIMADDGLNKKEVSASIAGLRDEMRRLQETAVSAAQRSAEEAISAGLNGPSAHNDAEPMMALRQQFDKLQDTSKSAELQNQDTLEAVHDTLEKVVERLTTLETSPPPSVEQPAREKPAANFGLNADGFLETDADTDSETTQYQTSSPAQEDQRIDPIFDEPVADESNRDKDAADRRPGPALNQNYLEAARRAAQAASLMPKNLSDGDKEKPEESSPAPKNNFLALSTDSGKKRKTLLLAAAAVLLVIGALSATKLITDRSANTANSSASTPAATLSKEKVTNAPSKKNKKTTEAPTAASTKAVKPVISPVSQNTFETPPNNPAAQSASSPTPPRITTSAATLSELTGTRQVKSPRSAVKVARLAPTASNQPAVLNDASRAELLRSLPPKEIGPIALRRAAVVGNAAAQFEIASRYTTGKLVLQDFDKAISWYQKAAAQGLAPAQYVLGTFYEKGRGVTIDKASARIWYERAAMKGNLKAIHNLAVIYADGGNGKADFAKAGLWFRKAAELGLADSQYNLAILHDRGLGVSKDRLKAYFWFQIAGSQGDRDAKARADIIEKRMSADEIAQTKLLISNWRPSTLNQSANEVALPADGWQRPARAAQMTTGSPITKKQLTILAQGYLTRLGFNPGPADGVLGAQTRQAIEKFQQRHQLPVSGNINADLVNKLKAAIG